MMVTFGLVIASLIGAPWVTLSCILAAYLISIPFAVRSYRQICARTGKCDADDSPIELTDE